MAKLSAMAAKKREKQQREEAAGGGAARPPAASPAPAPASAPAPAPAPAHKKLRPSLRKLRICGAPPRAPKRERAIATKASISLTGSIVPIFSSASAFA